MARRVTQLLSSEYIERMAQYGIKLFPMEGPIDPGVEDLVVLLNRIGVKTENSCDGHGKTCASFSFYEDKTGEEKTAWLLEVVGRFPGRGRSNLEKIRSRWAVLRYGGKTHVHSPFVNVLAETARMTALLEKEARERGWLN